MRVRNKEPRRHRSESVRKSVEGKIGLRTLNEAGIQTLWEFVMQRLAIKSQLEGVYAWPEVERLCLIKQSAFLRHWWELSGWGRDCQRLMYFRGRERDNKHGQMTLDKQDLKTRRRRREVGASRHLLYFRSRQLCGDEQPLSHYILFQSWQAETTIPNMLRKLAQATLMQAQLIANSFTVYTSQPFPSSQYQRHVNL